MIPTGSQGNKGHGENVVLVPIGIPSQSGCLWGEVVLHLTILAASMVSGGVEVPYAGLDNLTRDWPCTGILGFSLTAARPHRVPQFGVTSTVVR